MSIKKYIIFYAGIILTCAAGLSSLIALDVPGSKAFTAYIDFGRSVIIESEPGAELHFTIKGSNQNQDPKTVTFNTTKFLLFTESLSKNSLQLTNFAEPKYFPNDIVIQFDMIGVNPSDEQKRVALSGEVVIKAEDVRAPGILYYIEAHDSYASTLYYSKVVDDTVPEQDQWREITISNSISTTITPAGGTFVFPDPNPRDGEVQMVFPVGAVETNVEISVRRNKEFFSPQTYNQNVPIITYTLEPDHFTLKKGIQASFLYPDIDDHPGIVDGTELDENKLAVFWHDGFEWRSLGGTINPEDNLINLSLGHFSQYGIFAAANLSSDQYRPKERIITPASADGINDIAQFDNLAGRSDITIKIFDITGRKIRDISSPYVWDGKDDDGEIVETGVYIYQFDVDGTLISGTIAVAK
ncbi:MAG: gliding motility-associated C-terminal domain-containing protein [bacterium]